MGRLEGKVAIVVGAGQTPGQTIGNGRATAIRFAEEGATVMLVDRDEASAAETLEMMRARGGEGSVYVADVTSEDECAALIGACVDRYGRIDVLHNNVGIGAGDRGATSITEEAWDRIFSTNMKAIMFTCKHAVPIMREQGSGVITNISSVAAVCAVGLTAYKASKAAVNAYTHSLATGNARYGIRANVIMPGLMNTPMAIEGNVALGNDREEVIARRDAQVPLGAKMGSGWDIANAALFLASDEAGFITGVCLPVDGGQAARIG
ncbi:MAG: SDR family oxidoreductase [Gammaproteobacteria bacterium]|nr:SDR family oxidoreductase [Gammaproteobacteria bacterium]